MTASKLAMFGGSRALTADRVTAEAVAWPVVTAAERAAILRVLDTGLFTSNNPGDGEVQLLEREWAHTVGTAHCAGLSNGTAALEIALAAAGVAPGSEILVPALSFIASAVAPIRQLVVPVFVDIDPVTFTMDPIAAAAAVTSRTSAIMAVHLHGLPCDMTALLALARRHGLLLLEDAAQAHLAEYQHRRAGALGDVAAFSLNPRKNLPTCGEGGLLTTDDEQLHARALRQRQFGERLEGRRKRDYISHELAGNAKLSAIQAAFTRCQVRRLDDYHAARDLNVRRLLDRLGRLPGLLVPQCPGDRTHAWHMLRFRFSPEAMGLGDVSPGAVRTILERALRAEGVPVQQYQVLPLPLQRAVRDRRGLAGYPWRLPGADRPLDRAEDHPVTVAVIEDSLTLQRWHLNPAAGPVLDGCAKGFEKVWEHLGQIGAVARALEYTPLWRRSRHDPESAVAAAG